MTFDGLRHDLPGHPGRIRFAGGVDVSDDQLGHASERPREIMHQIQRPRHPMRLEDDADALITRGPRGPNRCDDLAWQVGVILVEVDSVPCSPWLKSAGCALKGAQSRRNGV